MPKTVVLILTFLFFNSVALSVKAEELRSCGGLSAKLLNKMADTYKGEISRASKKYGVSQGLIKSVIASESCFRDMVVSCKGASGLMQLMPSTAAMYGTLDIFDPAENIEAGTRHLAGLLRRYSGSLTHVIAAYNAGEGRIEADAPVTISFKETRGYINNVLTALTKFEAAPAANQQAQLLLAQWQQTEREYQAALRGEPLPPTVMLTSLEQATSTGITEANSTKLQPSSTPGLLLPPTNLNTLQRSGRIISQVPSATPATEALSPEQLAALQELTPSEPKEKNAKAKQAKAAELALAKQQAAALVDEKHANSIQAQSSAASQDVILEAKTGSTELEEKLAVVEEGKTTTPTAASELASCDTLPDSVLRLTRPGGSGRYAVFFYPAPAGETLMRMADKLGVDVRDILRLNHLQLDDTPSPGQKLKVAECLR